MSSIIAHALAGGTVQQVGARFLPKKWQGWKGLALALSVGILPDLDAAIPLILSGSDLRHRGMSHSLVIALLIAIACTVILKSWKTNKTIGTLLVFSLIASLHPVMDWGMGAGPPVQFLSPFSEKGSLAGMRYLPTAPYPKTFSQAIHAYTHNGRFQLALAMELAFWIPLFTAASLTRKRVRGLRQRTIAWVIGLGTSGIVYWLSFYKMNY